MQATLQTAQADAQKAQSAEANVRGELSTKLFLYLYNKSMKLITTLSLVLQSTLSIDTSCHTIKKIFKDNECCYNSSKTFPFSYTPVIDRIRSTGTFRCGIKATQFQNGTTVAKGGINKYDQKVCQLVATALNATLTFVPADAYTRFPLIASGKIDMLARATTWSTSRSMFGHLGAINLYDGATMLINRRKIDKTLSLEQLKTVPIRVCTGSEYSAIFTIEALKQDYQTTTVSLQTDKEGAEAFNDYMSQIFFDSKGDQCDAFYIDRSVLIDFVSDNPDTSWFPLKGDNATVLDKTYSKEYLGTMTPPGDLHMQNIARSVWEFIVTAEQRGWTRENADSMSEFMQGNLGLPLDDAWRHRVLKAHGNYAQVWADSWCNKTHDGVSGSNGFSSLECIDERKGYNRLVSEGGLVESIAMY